MTSATLSLVAGWLAIWAVVFSGRLVIQAAGAVPKWLSLAREYVPAVLLIIMAGQYACGIEWNFSYEYSLHLAHKLTSLALMEGKLYYPYSFAYGLDEDYQVYNGAVFTNWGYGVPLLQAPFHVLARVFTPSKGGLAFFPDRLIFLFYYTISGAYAYYAVRQFMDTIEQWKSAAKPLAAVVVVLALFSTTLF